MVLVLLTAKCILIIVVVTDLPDTERKQKNEDLIPQRQPRNRHDSDSDSDISPPRVNSNTKHGLTARHDSDSDISEKRGGKYGIATRHDSDSDASVKRTLSGGLRHDSDSDPSPPRRTRSDLHNVSGAQQAVQEQPYKRHISPTVLETARRKPNPDRKRRNSYSSDSDLSPRRESRQQLSSRTRDELQRYPTHKSDSDLSPERCDAKKRRTVDDEDLSPVRKPVSADSSKTCEKATKTLSGAKAGLQSASDMKMEARELKKREEEAFAKVNCIKIIVLLLISF